MFEHIVVRIDRAPVIGNNIHNELTHNLAVRKTVLKALSGLFVFLIEEVGLVNISRSEFGSIDFKITEETSSLPDGSDERRADHRGTIGVNPRVLFRNSEDFSDGEVSLEHNFVQLSQVEVVGTQSLVDGFTDEGLGDSGDELFDQGQNGVDEVDIENSG